MSYYHYDQPDVELDKEIDVDVDFNSDTCIDINIDKNVDVWVDIDVKANVEGNTAQVVFDAEAIGYDTFVEVDLTVIAIENTMSHASGVISAVVG